MKQQRLQAAHLQKNEPPPFKYFQQPGDMIVGSPDFNCYSQHNLKNKEFNYVLNKSQIDVNALNKFNSVDMGSSKDILGAYKKI